MRSMLLELSWSPLVTVAIVLAVMPITPEPHLLQKARWLIQGQPFRPIDVFDVVFHLAPTFVIVAKLIVHWTARS